MSDFIFIIYFNNLDENDFWAVHRITLGFVAHSDHILACIGPSVKRWPARPDVKVCDLIDIQGLFGTCCLISKAVEKLLLSKPSVRIFG